VTDQHLSDSSTFTKKTKLHSPADIRAFQAQISYWKKDFDWKEDELISLIIASLRICGIYRTFGNIFDKTFNIKNCENLQLAKFLYTGTIKFL